MDNQTQTSKRLGPNSPSYEQSWIEQGDIALQNYDLKLKGWA